MDNNSKEKTPSQRYKHINIIYNLNIFSCQVIKFHYYSMKNVKIISRFYFFFYVSENIQNSKNINTDK